MKVCQKLECNVVVKRRQTSTQNEKYRKPNTLYHRFITNIKRKCSEQKIIELSQTTKDAPPPPPPPKQQSHAVIITLPGTCAIENGQILSQFTWHLVISMSIATSTLSFPSSLVLTRRQPHSTETCVEFFEETVCCTSHETNYQKLYCVHTIWSDFAHWVERLCRSESTFVLTECSNTTSLQ